MVRWTKTEAGRQLAVDLAPDPGGNTAVWRDVHGVLRSRRVTADRPLAPHEKLMMPHAATCPAAKARRRRRGPAGDQQQPPPRPPRPPRGGGAGGELYERLGVTRAATAQEIKRAYRQLHPDLYPGDPVAGEKFKGVTEAYDVLADPGRRATYDLTGRPPRPR